MGIPVADEGYATALSIAAIQGIAPDALDLIFSKLSAKKATDKIQENISNILAGVVLSKVILEAPSELASLEQSKKAEAHKIFSIMS